MVGKLSVALSSFAALVAGCLVALWVVSAPAAPARQDVSAEPVASALPQAGGRGGGAATAQPAPQVPSGPRAAPQGRAVAPAVAFPYRPEPQWLSSSPNRDIGRGGAPVRYVVIHYTAISYERTLKAFTLPSSGVSAHYIVRRDGHVAQMVGEADTAWHAGNYWYNQRSIGIELELDPITNPAYTPQQYYAAAALTCEIAKRHGIPLDRAHIVGHNEIPGARGKIDPGPTWGWPHFMWLTSLCAPPTAETVRAQWVSQSAFPEVAVGDSVPVTVTLRNTGATAWRKGTPQEARLGIRGNETGLAFLGPNWPAADRPALQNEAMVPPGGLATFTFSVYGAQPGRFTIPLRGVVDGAAWMDDLGIYTVVTVKPKPKAVPEGITN
jgi:N-acetyl-anhydromuramyl-L-alanine amidase AmpD